MSKFCWLKGAVAPTLMTPFSLRRGEIRLPSSLQIRSVVPLPRQRRRRPSRGRKQRRELRAAIKPSTPGRVLSMYNTETHVDHVGAALGRKDDAGNDVSEAA